MAELLIEVVYTRGAETQQYTLCDRGGPLGLRSECLLYATRMLERGREIRQDEALTLTFVSVPSGSQSDTVASATRAPQPPSRDVHGRAGGSTLVQTSLAATSAVCTVQAMSAFKLSTCACRLSICTCAQESPRNECCRS